MVKRNSPTGLGHLSSQVHTAESSWLWGWSSSPGVWGVSGPSGPRDSSASGSSAEVWRLTHCTSLWSSVMGHGRLWAVCQRSPCIFAFAFYRVFGASSIVLSVTPSCSGFPFLLPDCTLNFSPPQSSRVAECQGRAFSQRCPKHARCVWWSSGCHGMRRKT